MAISKIVTIIGNKLSELVGINVSTGVADAEKYVALDATGRIDISMMPVGIGRELYVREASESLSIGDFVNVFDDAGTDKVRRADASAFSTQATGYVDTAYVVTNLANVFGEGVSAGYTGLTVGDPVFLDATTPGGVTQTPPTAAGEIFQQVGIAISDTEIKVELQQAIELT